MKNPADTQTLELPSLPKKRGRPPCTNPKSGAERQRQYMMRKQIEKKAEIETAEIAYQTLTMEQLMARLTEGTYEDVQRLTWLEIGRRNGWVK